MRPIFSTGLPIFSVVMPAYNAECTIGEAINSVIAQTFSNWELLVVDDCSSDGTVAVSKAFRDHRIQVFRTPRNINAAGARNLALEHAKGEFVAFLDSDDLAAPERLHLQYEFLQKNPKVGIVGTRVETFHRTSSPEDRRLISYPLTDGGIKAVMYFYPSLITSSVTVRASVLRDLTPPVFRKETAPCEDYDLWARLMRKTDFANIQETLTFYRVHAGQLNQTHKVSMLREMREVHKRLFQELGIGNLEENLDIHVLIAKGSRYSYDELARIEAWLETLWAAGGAATHLPQLEWSKYIGLVWFNACKRHSRLSPGVWSVYSKSPLYKWFLSRRRKLRFFLACLSHGRLR